MSITTFADLITTPGTKKVFLVETEPSHHIEDWAAYTNDRIDRGDCESIVSPMIFDETTPILTRCTWARDNAQAYAGTYSYKFTKAIAAGTNALVDLVNPNSEDLHGLIPGKKYTFKVRIWIPSGGILGSEITLRFYEYSGGFTDQPCANLYDQWQLVELTVTLNAATTGIILRLDAHANAANNEYFYVDNIILTDTIYRKEINTVHVLSVDEDGVQLTESSRLKAIGSGEWWYDGDYLYIQSSSGTPYQNVMVANYRMYFGSESKIFNDRFYEPFVAGVPSINQNKNDWFWGVSIVNSGIVNFFNDRGYFDSIYDDYAWANKNIAVLAGGEDLPYSEYAKMFVGKIKDLDFSTSRVKMSFEDSKEIFQDTLPLNTYTTGVYPNLHSDDVGKPIPYPWGTVIAMPVICTNRTETTATYNFDVADTSTHSIQAISTAYVNGVSVSPGNVNLTAGTFTLPSATYTPGDEVAADVSGYLSGTILINNPIDQAREIAELIGLTDADWDTTARATARTEAEDFPTGLPVTEFTSALDLIADLMKSCMGTMYLNNEGEIAVSIWTTDIPTNPDSVSEIEVADFKAVKKRNEIRKTLRVGWRKRWIDDTYAYKQQSSTETEKVHGITRTRTIQTLLSTEAGVDIYLSRMQLLYENATIVISFTHKLALALKNIGDRFAFSFKRRQGDSDISWLSSKIVEIQSIDKDFENNEIKITADDLKGIGASIGHWTDEILTFPDYVGGRTATEYDSAWSDTRREYAHAAWGFWCDDDGFADPGVLSSKDISRWW